MESITKKVLVGEDAARKRWSTAEVERLFASHEVVKPGSAKRYMGWDFSVECPGHTVEQGANGPKTVWIDGYTEEQQLADIQTLNAKYGLKRVTKSLCGGLDLDVREDYKPDATLKTKMKDQDKAWWCLGNLPKKDTNNKTPQQLVEMYDAVNPATA